MTFTWVSLLEHRWLLSKVRSMGETLENQVRNWGQQCTFGGLDDRASVRYVRKKRKAAVPHVNVNAECNWTVYKDSLTIT